MTQSAPTIKNITTYRGIYGDTDQMGIVYYANYLGWFERGRSEFLRQTGVLRRCGSNRNRARSIRPRLAVVRLSNRA